MTTLWCLAFRMVVALGSDLTGSDRRARVQRWLLIRVMRSMSHGTTLRLPARSPFGDFVKIWRHDEVAHDIEFGGRR